MNDFIGDMLICICNVQMCGKLIVLIFVLKLCVWVLDVLVDEGYICGYEKVVDDCGYLILEISLKYFEGILVICELKWVLKFGCCVYMGVKDILLVCQGLGVLIVFIFKGVMLDVNVCVVNIGGEVLCIVF